MHYDNLKTTPTILDFPTFKDARGFNLKPDMSNAVEAMISFSKENTIRGLHYQVRDPQTKRLRCVSGEILDVCVDLRSGNSFGKVHTFWLTTPDKELVVPKGFAHGFWATKDATVFYSYDIPHNPENDVGVNPFDKTLIQRLPWYDLWLYEKTKNLDSSFIVSARDKHLPSIETYVDSGLLPL